MHLVGSSSADGVSALSAVAKGLIYIYIYINVESLGVCAREINLQFFFINLILKFRKIDCWLFDNQKERKQ